jgi:NADH dehydrogenase (ubiquinone) 1 alpha/beta subcomplex 1
MERRWIGSLCWGAAWSAFVAHRGCVDLRHQRLSLLGYPQFSRHELHFFLFGPPQSLMNSFFFFLSLENYINMFSAGRVLASRVAVRAANTSAFSAIRQPLTIRTFAATTFLEPADVTERIINVIKNFDQVDSNKISDKVKFTEDLGLDSLDVVEVVMAIEDEFAIEIPDAEADKIASIQDAVEYITSHPMAK